MSVDDVFLISLDSLFAFHQCNVKTSQLMLWSIPRQSTRSSRTTVSWHPRRCEGSVRARFLRVFLLSDTETPLWFKNTLEAAFWVYLSASLCEQQSSISPRSLPSLPPSPSASPPCYHPSKPKKPALPWRQPHCRRQDCESITSVVSVRLCVNVILLCAFPQILIGWTFWL